MRNKRTMEQRLHDIVSAEAKRVGPRTDFLTMEQWLETLAYFKYKCAYCGCNVMKDKYGHDLSFYQNENVLRFIDNKGVKICFHIHEYRVLKEAYVILICETCGKRLDAPGASMEEAQAFIDQYCVNTGYAYIE